MNGIRCDRYPSALKEAIGNLINYLQRDHPDYLSLRIDERPPAVAGVGRGINLDHFNPVDVALRRYDPLRNGNCFSQDIAQGETDHQNILG